MHALLERLAECGRVSVFRCPSLLLASSKLGLCSLLGGNCLSSSPASRAEELPLRKATLGTEVLPVQAAAMMPLETHLHGGELALAAPARRASGCTARPSPCQGTCPEFEWHDPGSGTCLQSLTMSGLTMIAPAPAGGSPRGHIQPRDLSSEQTD